MTVETDTMTTDLLLLEGIPVILTEEDEVVDTMIGEVVLPLLSVEVEVEVMTDLPGMQEGEVTLESNGRRRV